MEKALFFPVCFYNIIVMKKLQILFSSFFVLGVFLCMFAFSYVFAEEQSRYVSINDNDAYTTKRSVVLKFSRPKHMDGQMRIANSYSGLSDANWMSFRTRMNWTLPSGEDEDKTVYVQFSNKAKTSLQVYSDFIRLKKATYKDFDFSINGDADKTLTRYVTLEIDHPEAIERLRISNSNSFDSSAWQEAKASMPWVLSEKSGNKTVRIEFEDSDDKKTVISHTIQFEDARPDIESGTLLKGVNSLIYYVGNDGKLHPYVDAQIYHTWYKSFNDVKLVSDAKIAQYQIGSPVCVRPGTWLVRFPGDSRVFASEPGCVLRPMYSEIEAKLLYGENWEQKVVNLQATLKGFYTIRDMHKENLSSHLQDSDKDGVDVQTEREYGSSDGDSDSDNDGLTDYEEIFIWFTDPKLADTDGDSYTDGGELANGYSPNGAQRLTSLPDNALSYPVPSFVKGVNDRNFRNTYAKHFISTPFYPLNDSIKKTVKVKYVNKPTILVNGTVVEL